MHTHRAEAYSRLFWSQQQMTTSWSLQTLFLSRWSELKVLPFQWGAPSHAGSPLARRKALSLTSMFPRWTQDNLTDTCRQSWGRMDMFYQGCDTVFQFMVQNSFFFRQGKHSVMSYAACQVGYVFDIVWFLSVLDYTPLKALNPGWWCSLTLTLPRLNPWAIVSASCDHSSSSPFFFCFK